MKIQQLSIRSHHQNLQKTMNFLKIIQSQQKLEVLLQRKSVFVILTLLIKATYTGMTKITSDSKAKISKEAKTLFVIYLA